MTVLLLGNSQARALILAYDRRLKNGTQPNGQNLDIRPLGSGRELLGEFYSERDEAIVTHTQHYQSMTFSRNDLKYDAIGIAAPLYTLAVCGTKDWKNFRPSHLSGSGAPVSRGLFGAMAAYNQRHTLGFIDSLQKLGKRVFVVEAARLFRHHESVAFCGAEVISEVDRLYRDIIIQELQKRSVPVVYVPARHLDDLGFMRDEHRLATEGDQNHANIDFGDIMIDEIASQMDVILTR